MNGKRLVVLAFVGAMACAGIGLGQAQTSSDEQLLKSAGIAIDNEGLLTFFRNRSLKEADRPVLEELVRKLGSSVYREREEATAELTKRGPVAVPFIKAGLKDALLETARRGEQIIKRIESTQAPDFPAAAARLRPARKVPAAAQVLLDYLPFVADDWVEEEVLGSFGALTVRPGKIDSVLTAALKDQSAGKRAAAVYVLGRRGDMAQRDTVRSLFADSDELVRRRAAESLTGKRPSASYKDLAGTDEGLLRGQNLGTDEPALLDILRKRTLNEDDQKRLRQLIVELGAATFNVRNRASKLLVKEGTPALAFLRPALDHPDAEVVRRANLCIEDIRRGPGPALPTAAIRLLARPAKDTGHSPAAAIRVLLAYVPFADDEQVEEEVFTALTILSTRETRIDPLLPEALRDPLASRRAAAAHVVGRVGTSENLAPLRRLLDDPVPSVRLRAAQGLLMAKDRTAVPRLIALLGDVPAASLWQVEDTLQRLAGDRAPVQTAGDGAAEKRQAAVKAWDLWFAANGSTLDLARLADGEAHLGLVTVCEYDSAIGQPGGQVWEMGRDNKERWKFGGVLGAMDAQVLPNGRVLVAENSANRVTERDLAGAIKWEYRTPGNPIACQRLLNGNTFIATYNQVMEITPDHRQLYLQTRGPQFYIFSARKGKDGIVTAMTAQGTILRFDPVANKDYPSINLGPNGGWCSAEALPNGRFLVATMNNGQVREIDDKGGTHWTITMPGAFRATRLPNGNTLVASMTTRQVAEFDKSGVKRWEKTCPGRPWSVRYR